MDRIAGDGYFNGVYVYDLAGAQREEARQAVSRLARTLTQAQWDALYPPQPPKDHEPPDASGFAEDCYGDQDGVWS